MFESSEFKIETGFFGGIRVYSKEYGRSRKVSRFEKKYLLDVMKELTEITLDNRGEVYDGVFWEFCNAVLQPNSRSWEAFFAYQTPKQYVRDDVLGNRSCEKDDGILRKIEMLKYTERGKQAFELSYRYWNDPKSISEDEIDQSSEKFLNQYKKLGFNEEEIESIENLMMEYMAYLQKSRENNE